MDKNEQHNRPTDEQPNENRQGVDKDPKEEQGKSEKVNMQDLKGKKVDGDPSQEQEQPSR